MFEILLECAAGAGLGILAAWLVRKYPHSILWGEFKR